MYVNRPYEVKNANNVRQSKFSIELDNYEETLKRVFKDPVSVFDMDCGPEEEYIMLEHKEDPMEKLLNSIKRNKFADAAVVIGGHTFLCHSDVLNTFTKRLVMTNEKKFVIIDTPQLTARTFSIIYQWILDQSTMIRPSEVVEILRGASYLHVTQLLEHCWNLVDSQLYNNFSAFCLLYQGRRAHELTELHELMASRISTGSMIMFASREFLCLNRKQVCALMSSNTLTVNSEIEVLYSALNWLNFKWPARVQAVPEVLASLRYGFMSPEILSKFRHTDIPNGDIFQKILHVFSVSSKMPSLVQNGMFYSTLVITAYSDEDTLRESLRENDIKMQPSRNWAVDRQCPYHRRVTQNIPNMRYISYKKYKSYLTMLASCPHNFDEFMRYRTPSKRQLKEGSGSEDDEDDGEEEGEGEGEGEDEAEDEGEDEGEDEDDSETCEADDEETVEEVEEDWGQVKNQSDEDEDDGEDEGKMEVKENDPHAIFKFRKLQGKKLEKYMKLMIETTSPSKDKTPFEEMNFV